jgi:hypothetical protein
MCAGKSDNNWNASKQIEWLHAHYPTQTKQKRRTKQEINDGVAAEEVEVKPPSKKTTAIWYNHIMSHIFDFASAGYCVKLGQAVHIGRLSTTVRDYTAPGATKSVPKARVAFKASSALVVSANDAAAAVKRSGARKSKALGKFPAYIQNTHAMTPDNKPKKTLKEIASAWNRATGGSTPAKDTTKLTKAKAERDAKIAAGMKMLKENKNLGTKSDKAKVTGGKGKGKAKAKGKAKGPKGAADTYVDMFSDSDSGGSGYDSPKASSGAKAKPSTPKSKTSKPKAPTPKGKAPKGKAPAAPKSSGRATQAPVKIK